MAIPSRVAKIMVIQDEPGLAVFMASTLHRQGSPPRVAVLAPAPGNIVEQLLRKDGHQVAMAGNSQEAFTAAQDVDAELVMLDKAVLDLIMEELRKTQALLDGLSGFLPICSHCKKIRKPDATWEPIENFLSQHLAAEFTHTLCPDHLEAAHSGS